VILLFTFFMEQKKRSIFGNDLFDLLQQLTERQSVDEEANDNDVKTGGFI